MTYCEFDKTFKSVVQYPDDFIVSKEAESCLPVFNITKRSKNEKSHATYAIKFFPDKDVCIVWNYKRHRDKNAECGAGLSSLDIGKSLDMIETGHDVFYPIYKKLGNKNGFNKKRLYEKVYIVGTSHLVEFFEQYQPYMELNSKDEEFPNDTIEDGLWHSDAERKKYSSYQYQRDKKFREDVLEAYGHRCAVCRCSADEVLQAAHMRDYRFADTGCLDPKHGICLCANHHLMYDHYLIDLDTEKLTLEITEKGKYAQIDQMPWYKEFNDIYKRKILGRNEHE